jgi:Leucine-rich repeat (LRR) protein
MAPRSLLLPLLALLGPVGSQGPGTAAQTPNDCKRQALQSPTSSDQQFLLYCDLRTINSEYDQTDFSVIPSAGTVSLAIRCAKAIQHQSQLYARSFQHLGQLEALSIEYCKLADIPSDSFHGLGRLENLTLVTHALPASQSSLTLAPATLAPLTRLLRLDLSYNALWGLPERELCHLASLQYLNVSRNQLQDLNDLGLPSSPDCSLNLGSLDISHNRLRAVNPGALETARHLKALFLQNNQISQVHDGALRGLANLKSLDLSGNEIVALPASLFEDTPQLQQLKLDHNQLSVISSRLFRPLASLIILDLSANILKTGCETCITKKSFRGLERLVVLNLAGNKLSQIKRAMFEDLGNLQSLDISDNSIEVIPAEAFRRLSNLYSLQLSQNKIGSLNLGSLGGMQRLTSLDLQNNSIVNIHKGAFRNLTFLQDLNLFKNHLLDIPEAVQSLSALKTIDLGRNRISSIANSSLAGLSSLIGLKMDHNRVSGLSPAALAVLPNLQILNLGGKRIREVERGSFTQNKKLQAVRLDANQISDIVGLFNDLPALRWLNISDNQIQKFDYFLLPVSLNWLDIHKNQIEDIGNYFDKEDELNIHTMDISFNKLETITAKSIPDKIQTLSLNDNLITRIHPLAFFSKRHLVRVDLYANQIVKMDMSSIRLPPREVGSSAPRPEFYFGGNPFLCDCNLEWLKTINKEENAMLYPRVNDLESIYCRLMYSKENPYIPLVEAKSTDFLCSYETHCFSLCHCCDFDACDCEMTCPDNCTCYHDQSWSTNIVECSSSSFSEPPNAIPMDATAVYLHGNNFGILGSHAFIGRKNLNVLYLNNSNIDAVLNHTFYGLTGLTRLHLENNNIRRLEGHEFLSLQGLKELLLHNNMLNFIEYSTFEQLTSLEVLTLENNRLFSFPGHFSLQRSPYLVEISLSSNPWSCGCEAVEEFRRWLSANQARVIDSSKVACYLNNSNMIGKYIMEETDCSALAQRAPVSESSRLLTDNLPVIIVSLSVFIVLLVSLSVLLYYRSELRIWVFSQWGLRLCHVSPSCDQDTEKMYDAYISYSIKDESFVSQVLGPELEHGEPSYRLCLHYRDLPHNAYVADSITEAVTSSKRSIIILSNNFVVHEWTRYDVRSALHEVLKSRGKSIILVLGDIPYRDLDPDLRLYLKRNTTIHWSDRLFWDKLRFHLPPAPPARAVLQASLPAGYCQAIYEVPQFSNHHHLTLSHQHKIYEQRTLESQLTQKIY